MAINTKPLIDGGTVTNAKKVMAPAPVNTAPVSTSPYPAAISTPTAAVPTAAFPAAGTFMGWDYVGQTSSTGTLRRQILADGKGGTKVNLTTEKNPDYISGSRGAAAQAGIAPVVQQNIPGGVTPTGPTLASDTFKQTLAIFFGATEAAKPWVTELYNVTSKFYKTGSTIDESFNLALQDSRNNPALKEFTSRFSGIYALQDKKTAGAAVSVPTIAEYYAAEAGMGSVLRQAGLGSIATQDYLGGVIGKGLSVTDVGNYINGIYNEIQNLPQDIKDTVMTYYPNLDNVSLAKSILTGDKGFTQLQKELTTYEIQGAAARQGLGYNAVTNPGGLTQERAARYAAEGMNLQSALTGFGQVAATLPTVTFLSDITASKENKITQAGVEAAYISKTASEVRKLQQLALEEQNRMSGQKGIARNALSSPKTF